MTIKDVAREAKVSVATVSRALNGSADVTPATRARIERAAARLRYVPMGAARSLVTRRTQAIGALLPDLFGEFFSELIRGIDLAARTHGLHLLVSSSHGDANEAAVALRAMQGRVDGVLIMSPHVDAAFLRKHLADSIPAVLLDSPPREPRRPHVNIDNLGGARAMTQHLLVLGHRKIAFIEGPEGNRDARERRRGFEQTIAAQDGAIARYLEGDYSEESGHRAGRTLLAGRKLPDAVFAANDMMAIGCLSALNEAGVQVPDQIALAGFDDIPIARYTHPPLTTVHVRIAQLGHAALERLVVQMQTPDIPEADVTTMPCEVVVRASCGFRATATGSGKEVQARKLQ
ncbi:MAG TPA: LacI family DNA-binding transcriptional regulator [Rhodanobacteraceae bacterium]|nr:LacI family DNA-binding transcriptional regulator [Rhodanobacteraceae bacterium]